jgi:hypothetical protein
MSVAKPLSISVACGGGLCLRRCGFNRQTPFKQALRASWLKQLVKLTV